MGSQSVRLIQRGVFVAAIAAGAAAFSGAAAHADIPTTTIQWFSSADGNPIGLNCPSDSDGVISHGGGTWQFLGSLVGDTAAGETNPYWGLDWDVTVNGGAQGAAAGGPGSAFVTADLQVTNFSGTSQIFWALVTVALNDPIVGGTFMNGSSTAGVHGFGGSPASIYNPTSGEFAGDPVYTALIDNNPVRTLFDNFNLDTPGGPVSTSTTFGDPNPEIGPDAINSISVLLKIEVSAFATASVTGTFVIEQIPAPAGLPLLAGLAIFGRRRRRN